MPATASELSARRLDPVAVRAALRRLARASEPPWLHQEVARRMAERLEIIVRKPEVVVDWWSFLGAGGALLAQAYPKARRVVVEPGDDWLERSRAAGRAPWWAPGRWTGTASVQVQRESDPLPTNADLVWCNMALHMVTDPPALFERWHASLRTDGFVMFSCLGPGSLRRLRDIYRRFGWGEPAPGFIDMHDLGDMLVHAGFADPVMDQETLDLRYTDPAAVLAELRSLGGNTAPDRFNGLRTPRWRCRLEQELGTSLRGGDGKLGLGIEVAYGHAFKAGPKVREGAPTTVSLEDMRAMVRTPRTTRDGAGGKG